MAAANNSTRHDEKVNVVVRCRPMTATERSKVKKVVECVRSHDINVTTATTGVARGLGAVSHSKTYKFDKVFDSRSTQLDVYNAVVSSQLNDVLNGYNCTILAYGQTGTGKTYTMEGERSNDVNYSWDTDPKAGIIPRALSQLFDMLEQMGCEFSVRVSLLEIYNEEIYDLLSSSPEETKLKLYDDQSRKGSVVVAGLQEVRLQNKSAVYDILQDGAMKRKTAATKLNEFSSRSHSVFSVTVHTKDITQNGMEEEELVKIGKLNLVDLAGSENIGRSGAIDKRAREAGNINMSLLTLGRCITALVEHSPHVPYRESKLTRLLQDSLGGATKTSIIATISPGSDNLEETLSTLDYACRAKNIHNRPKVNQKLTKTALIKEYNDEIEKLRREVQAARDKNGVYLQPKQYDEMVLKIEDLTATLQQRSEELTELELLYGQNSQQLVDARRRVADLQEELSVVSQTLDEQRYVKEELADYSSQHYRQSLKLVEAAKTVESDVQQLHEKVGRVQQTNDSNLRTAGSFSGSLKAQINEMCGEAMGAFQQSEVHVRRVMDGVEQVMSMQDEDFSDLSSLIKGISRDLSEQLQESETAAASLVTEHTAQVEKQREIARHIHAAAEDNASKLKATLVGVRQAMSSLLPIVENLKARNEAQQVEIQQQRKTIQEFENNVADHLDSIRCNVDALANEQEANMNAIEARVTSFASELFASTRAMKEKSASQREAERNIDAVARFADHVTGHMQRHLVAEEEHSVAAVRSVEKHVTRCVSDVTSAADRGEEQQTAFSATVDDSSESLKGELDDGLASLMRQVDHFATIVQRANAAHGNATSSALADMTDKLSERRDEVRREVAPLDDVAGAARSRHDAMHDALVEALVGIDDFYQDKLARVVPTGQTPAKQEYKYKRAITPPPEESRLVERFRSSRSNDDPPAAGAGGDSHDDPAVLDDAFRTSEQEESMDVEQNENVLNESVTIPDCGGIPFFKAGKNGGGINTRKRR